MSEEIRVSDDVTYVVEESVATLTIDRSARSMFRAWGSAASRAEWTSTNR